MLLSEREKRKSILKASKEIEKEFSKNTNKKYPPSSRWNNFIFVTGNNRSRIYLNGVLITTFKNISFQEY